MVFAVVRDFRETGTCFQVSSKLDGMQSSGTVRNLCQHAVDHDLHASPRQRTTVLLIGIKESCSHRLSASANVLDDLLQFLDFFTIHQKALLWRKIGHVFSELLISVSQRVASFVPVVDFVEIDAHESFQKECVAGKDGLIKNNPSPRKAFPRRRRSKGSGRRETSRTWKENTPKECCFLVFHKGLAFRAEGSSVKKGIWENHQESSSQGFILQVVVMES